MDAQTIKVKLQSQIVPVLEHLFPDGQLKGRVFHLGSVQGEAGSSLHVLLEGDLAGVWKDHATGEKGDIFQLWMLHKNINFVDMLDEARRYLGITEVKKIIDRKPLGFTKANYASLKQSAPERYLTQQRGINPDTLHRYMVRSNPEGTAYAFPYITPEKQRAHIKYCSVNRDEHGKKKIWSTKPFPTLWGWWMVTQSDRSIIITEGEIDAMTVYQMQPGMPVLSMHSGTNDMGWIDNDFHALNQFETIYVITDRDEPGDLCAEEISKRLGQARVKRVPIPMPYSDPNEMWMSGDESLMFWEKIAAAAYYYTPQTIRKPSSYVKEAKRLAHKAKEERENNTFMFPHLPYSFRDTETTIVSGFPGHGKALDLDTEVPTPSGFRRLGEVHAGDYVIAGDGTPTKVSAESECFIGRNCYKFTFDDGSFVVCDEEHLWDVETNQSRNSKQRQRRKTQRIGNDQRHKCVRDKILTAIEIANTFREMDRSYYSIENVKFIGKEMMLPISPYVLGAWIGDSSSAGIGFTCHDNDIQIIDKIRCLGYKVIKWGGKFDYGIQGILKHLRLLRLHKNKHIPDIYLYASVEQRLDLLQGLMDTDGSCYRGQLEFCTISKDLAVQVLQLVCSLGIKGNIIDGDATIDGRFISKKYRVTFTTSIPVFSLRRKLIRQRKKCRPVVERRYIVNVEKVKSVPTKCIKVEHHSGTFLCTRNYIKTHNSDWLYQSHIHEMKNGKKVFICSLEIPPAKMLVILVQQMVGHEPTDSDIETVADWLDERMVYHSGHSPKGPDYHLQWEELLKDMEYAYRRYGVTRFIIDSLHFLVLKDDYEKQDKITRSLQQFNLAHGTHTALVAHSNIKGQKEGHVPGRHDVEGSGGMIKPIDNGITIWRNEEKAEHLQDPLGNNTTTEKAQKLHDGLMKIWKQRENGQHPTIKLWFDADSRTFRTFEWGIRHFFSRQDSDNREPPAEETTDEDTGEDNF